jgi:hypothetical protein
MHLIIHKATFYQEKGTDMVDATVSFDSGIGETSDEHQVVVTRADYDTLGKIEKILDTKEGIAEFKQIIKSKLDKQMKKLLKEEEKRKEELAAQEELEAQEAGETTITLKAKK